MTLEFQIYDFVEDHINNDDDEIGKYIINCFGRTLDDKSVYAKITYFTPHYYLSLPDDY